MPRLRRAAASRRPSPQAARRALGRRHCGVRSAASACAADATDAVKSRHAPVGAFPLVGACTSAPSSSLASAVALAVISAAAVVRATGVPALTTRRWLRWWRGPFVASASFVDLSARLVPAPDRRAFPPRCSKGSGAISLPPSREAPRLAGAPHQRELPRRIAMAGGRGGTAPTCGLAREDGVTPVFPVGVEVLVPAVALPAAAGEPWPMTTTRRARACDGRLRFRSSAR